MSFLSFFFSNNFVVEIIWKGLYENTVYVSNMKARAYSNLVLEKRLNVISFAMFICGLFISSFNKAVAQEKLRSDSSYFYNAYHSKFEIGGEYLAPTRFTNKIQTVSINVFYWKKYFKSTSVMLSAGVTGTYAWGYSAQFEPLLDTTIRITTYKNTAFGIGPVLQVDPTIVRIKRFSLIAEANGAMIFYNKRFPYGGDRYNFMFRAGPSITYKMNKNCSLKIGYRWMHVSNGQGYGNQNPFYEAQGFNISFLMFK